MDAQVQLQHQYDRVSDELNVTVGDRIKLNVGGRRFEFSRVLLSNNEEAMESMLGAMFSGRHTVTSDEDGSVFIDRDGDLFSHVLRWLQEKTVVRASESNEILVDALCKEADFFQLPNMKKNYENIKIKIASIVKNNENDKKKTNEAVKNMTIYYDDLKYDLSNQAKRYCGYCK